MATRSAFASLRPANVIHLGCALAVAVMLGCNNNGLPLATTSVPSGEGELFSIKINTTSHSLAAGATLSLAVAGFSDSDEPVAVTGTTKWKTSDAKTASVSTKGVVAGLKAGKVTITATTDNPPREATIALRVLGAGETPPPEPVDDNTGLDGGLTPDTDPNGGLYASPIGVAPSDFGGFTPPDGSGGLPDPTGPSPPPGTTLSVLPQNPVIPTNGRLRLVAVLGPGTSASSAAWSSSDTTVATVDEGGNVTGLKAGKVTITAASLAYPSLRQSVTLTVSAPTNGSQISGIRITPSKVSMSVGETFWLQAQVPTTTGDLDSNVAWQSGNTAVVTVSATGQLTGIAPGSTVVTATATAFTGGTLRAQIPVTVLNQAVSH